MSATATTYAHHGLGRALIVDAHGEVMPRAGVCTFEHGAGVHRWVTVCYGLQADQVTVKDGEINLNWWPVPQGEGSLMSGSAS